MDYLYGSNWHEEKWLIEQTLTPSKIYSAAVVEMFGGGLKEKPKAELHGVAHITGGGIPGKLGRMLKPSGYGAKLDDLFPPAPVMQYCIEKGKVPLEQAYTTFNMGNGMIIATPKPYEVMEIAEKYNIESKVSGKVTQESGIKIKHGKVLNSNIITYEDLVF